jgi:hypothetical protein
VCVSYPDILDIAYYQGTQRGIFDSGGNAYSSGVIATQFLMRFVLQKL